MNIVIIGCGYVADFYARNLRSHGELKLIGAFDENIKRRDAWCAHFDIRPLASLEEALSDPRVEMVLNLTNPRSHYSVSAAAIHAGKHVYTEKPLGLTLAEAKDLLAMAREHGVRIGCAPCNMMSDTVMALRAALQEGVIGKVRLAYANYDDGMIAPNERPWTWKSESGAPWPAKDEFEVGCTYEHAGYYLTVLAALFGPARTVTAYASVQVPDKGIAVDTMAPDFSVGCIEYDDGIVARVTAGLVAPRDKSLTIVGDRGVLLVRYLRNDREPILMLNDGGRASLRGWFTHRMRRVVIRLGLPTGDFGLYRPFRRPTGVPFAPAGDQKPVDFLRGPQDMADAIRTGQPHRLSGELGVHIVELIEVLQYPERFGYHHRIESILPLESAPWPGVAETLPSRMAGGVA